MIYRIFLELFKSKSPLRECSQDHETEHRSVSPISVKDPSSSPPTLEWLISCLRLPLVIFELYRDIRSPPPCNLFHQSVSCFFIRQNELPLFQTWFVPLSFSLYHPCASGSLVPSRHYFFHVVAIPLIWVWKLVWNLNYILILLPLLLFCSDVNTMYDFLLQTSFFLRLANKLSALQHHQVPLLIWKRKPSSPQPLPFFAYYGRPSYEAITLYRNLISFLRSLGSKFCINHSFLCILYIVNINIIPVHPAV